MAEVLVFHHAQGLTAGVLAFADELRRVGHDAHTADLYAGATFGSVESGVAHAESIGYHAIIDAACEIAQEYPPDLVYAGFSLGSLPAQKLAQTRPGARGALLYHGGAPLSTFGPDWPAGVRLQIHVMDDDEWAELDVAENLCEAVSGSDLFVYPGSAHLFADSSLADYDPAAAALLMERTLEFLRIVDLQDGNRRPGD